MATAVSLQYAPVRRSRCAMFVVAVAVAEVVASKQDLKPGRNGVSTELAPRFSTIFFHVHHVPAKVSI